MLQSHLLIPLFAIKVFCWGTGLHICSEYGPAPDTPSNVHAARCLYVLDNSVKQCVAISAGLTLLWKWAGAGGQLVKRPAGLANAVRLDQRQLLLRVLAHAISHQHLISATCTMHMPPPSSTPQPGLQLQHSSLKDSGTHT